MPPKPKPTGYPPQGGVPKIQNFPKAKGLAKGKAKAKGKALGQGAPVKAAPAKSPPPKKKKKQPEPEDDYDYFGIGSFFGGGEPAPPPPSAQAEAEQSWGAWAGIYDDDPPPTQAARTAPGKSGPGKAGPGKAVPGKSGPGKAGPGKAGPPGKAKAGKASPNTKAGPKGKAKAKAKSPNQTPRSQEDPEDLLDTLGFNALAEVTAESWTGFSYEGIFGASEDPSAAAGGAAVGGAAGGAAGGAEEQPSYFSSLFGGGEEAEDAYTDPVEDDGVGGLSYLFGAPHKEDSDEEPPLPPPPLPPLPPPPPPEPPPPPISRLRPWAPQLRAASQPRTNSKAEMKELPKTDPKMPPIPLDRHFVTADRRRALPKPFGKTDRDNLRSADMALCVADIEDTLSEPDSQGSAESISGDIVRSWDPSAQDSRWHYSRDTAVPFSNPWQPLVWNDAQWMSHLEETGAYNPRAHEDAMEAKEQVERDEDDALKAAVLGRALKGKEDQAALQNFAYGELQRESTPRGLAMKSFVPVPSNDPVVRPALADAIAAYKSIPRSAFHDLRMELEGGRQGAKSVEDVMGMVPWEEKDHVLDKPGRAWM